MSRPKTVDVEPGIQATPSDRTVIAWTRIRTRSVFNRFVYTRESIRFLRQRYGVLPWEIEAAIRWEAQREDVKVWKIVRARARRR